MNTATLLDPMGDPDFGNASEHGEKRAFEIPLIREYMAIVFRRRWLILGLVLMALLAGLIFTLLLTPLYTATSRIEISRQEQRVTNVEGIDSGDRTYDSEFYETQYALLKARSVAERVARELRLQNNFAFFEANGIDPENVDWLGDPNRPVSREELKKRQDTAVNLLLENIAIVPIPRSALVDLQYTSASPTIAANVANQWAHQFIQDSIDRRFASTADARQFLEQRLAELRKKVEESETQLVNYGQAKDIVVLDRATKDGQTVSSSTLTSTNLQAMNDALATATAERVALQARARTGQGASSATITNPAINSMRQRRAELSAQYAKLMVQFEPGYPTARALKEQIDDLDAAIKAEEARVRDSLQTDYRSAMDREQELRQRVNALTAQLRKQELDRIQYNIYQNEVDTNRQLYDGLLQRYKEIGVAGVSANNIAIVDTAQVPLAPTSPNLFLNLIVALFCGFALAGVVVFVLEQFDEGIREPGGIPRRLGIPVLGAIPVVDRDDIIDEIVDQKSEVSEAYLTVRSNLALSTATGIPRAIMVTSTRPTEGKSTSSFAIAAIFARTGKRVLLVDADMRSPSLHKFVDVENGEGFSSSLAGNDDWRSLVRETGLPRLSLITAGRIPPSAAELLSSDRLRRQVEAMQSEFDHIVIDAPPLLGLADAPLIARAVDGVVYIIEARGVPARGINISLDRLLDSNARILGGVLTKFTDDSSTVYGYGYGYGYGLKYGAET